MSNGFHGLAPFGLLEFAGDQTPAEEAYDALVAAYGGSASGSTPTSAQVFDLSPGTAQEAKVFASAIQIGLARMSVKAAAYQQSPATAYWKLPSLEKDWSVKPGPLDSADTRRAALVARKLLMHGARQEAIESDLRTLLGSAFFTLRVTKPTELATIPTSPSTTGAYQGPSIVPKYIQLLDPIAFLAVPLTIRYTLLSGSTAPTVGEVFSIDPNRVARVEAVTVASVTATAAQQALGQGSITATFTKPHDPNTYATTCTPWQLSNQRHVRVIVSQAAAQNAETRRKIHEIMQRHEKTVTDWDLLGVTSSTQVGPFIAGTSKVGVDACGTAAFTF